MPGTEANCNGRTITCNSECQFDCRPIPPAPVCPDEPSCEVAGDSVKCSWCTATAELVADCATVSREPFPYGLVGVPNQLRLMGCGGGVQTVEKNVRPLCPEYIDENGRPTGLLMDEANIPFKAIDVKIVLSLYCLPDQTVWRMGDRPDVQGRISTNMMTPYRGDDVMPPDRPDGPDPSLQGRLIRDIMADTAPNDTNPLVVEGQRQGWRIRHIYERSSDGLEPKGPRAYPADQAPHDAPSYMVDVQVTYGWSALFYYKPFVTVKYCADPSIKDLPVKECNGERGVDADRCNDTRNRTGVFADRREKASYVLYKTEYGTFTKMGARVIEDNHPEAKRICGPVPVPVKQVQTLIRPLR